jgi:3-oxoacyl-[acyl-carrier-protein] synthase-3
MKARRPEGFAAVVSTGRYVPPVEVTNDALRARFAKKAPEVVDKLEAATGIRTRFYAERGMTTSGIAACAAREAIARAGIEPKDLDLVLLGTDSPDHVTPATSVVLQHALGAKRAGTFDVGCACASFPTALATAAALMEQNAALEHVLVAGAYMMHRLADPDDPTVFFYGDGAGAVVLRRAREPGVLGATFRADGSHAFRWGVFSGGVAEPASIESVRAGRTNVRLVERYPPEVNDEGWPLLVRRLADEQGFAVPDIDLAIFTQVRRGTIETVMGALSLPMSRTHVIMDKWGYTGSACIPMALDDAMLAGRVKPGDLVVMVGSGVGFNQCAAAFVAGPSSSG